MINSTFHCSRCGEPTPTLRLVKYKYNFCVNCSDVKPKVGRVIVLGEGDHTVTEVEIVDQDIAKRLQELENSSRGNKSKMVEVLDLEEDSLSDDRHFIEGVNEKVNSVETPTTDLVELPELDIEEEEENYYEDKPDSSEEDE